MYPFKFDKIVFATGNEHKLEEVQAIAKLNSFDVSFVMPDKGFNPEENGKTFYENALIKAKEANKLTGKPSLADDSGLCVDFLNGAPGLYSARYAGTQKEKIKKLLDELKDVPYEKRGAKFVCAMVLLDKDGEKIISVEGECNGKIIFEPKGEGGFGYDPIFEIDGYNKTMSEVSDTVKNSISHRANALK